jgi:hypothetical protein
MPGDRSKLGFLVPAGLFPPAEAVVTTVDEIVAAAE